MTSPRDPSADRPAGIQIPCPKCGAELKLRDRQLLGRRGKCPKCEHRFVLEEPEEVELELADDAPVNTQNEPLNFETPAPAANDQALPDFSALAQSASAAATTATPITATVLAKRQRKTNPLQFWLILLTVAATGGGSLYYLTRPAGSNGGQPNSATQQAGGQPAGIQPGATSVVAKTTPVTDKEFQEFVSHYQPTNGGPIVLKWVPYGARVVIHLRPQEIWSDETSASELRSTWQPLFDRAHSAITETCLLTPEQIREVTFCLILAQRGVPPELAAVVSTVNIVDRSALEKQLGGQFARQGDWSVLENDGRSLLMVDEQTFAIMPSPMLNEVIENAGLPALTEPGIKEILKQSDRQRHITLAFLPADLPIHKPFLFPAEVGSHIDGWVEKYGKGVDAALWSLHLAEPAVSDLYLRNETAMDNRPLSSDELRGQLPARFKIGMQELQAGLAKHASGPDDIKRFAGRFPQMVTLLPAATSGETSTRLTHLKTVLPTVMLKNLAIGTRLLADQTLLFESTSTQADSTQPTQPENETAAKETPAQPTPATLEEKLATELEIDFRRTPLQEAIDYIAEESSIDISIDGDALKLAGYTKNMPQTFKLGTVTTKAALSEILKQYDKMVVARDTDNAGRLVISTKVKLGDDTSQQLLPEP